VEPYAFFDCSIRSSCCANAILIARHPSGTEVTCASCSGPVDRRTGESLRRRGPLPWEGARIRAQLQRMYPLRAWIDKPPKRGRRSGRGEAA
jgi:hypothetical protein